MRGFTLVELLATLAITGLLAALAVPGYRTVMQRALRQDARLALLQLQYRQEQHFARHLHYATPIAGQADGSAFPTRSDSGHYLLETRATTQGYIAIARADPAGRQAGDRHCTRLAVDQGGRRLVAAGEEALGDADPDRCWG